MQLGPSVGSIAMAVGCRKLDTLWSLPTRRSVQERSGLLLCGKAVKREHICRGHEWTEAHAQEVRDGTISCKRGEGLDRQSAEIDLDALAAKEWTLHGDVFWGIESLNLTDFKL